MNLLLIGLGNPGDNYQHNRHNAGFMFVDWLLNSNGSRFHFDKYSNAEIAKIVLTTKSQKMTAVLAKPQTFMNRSGQAIAKLVSQPTSIFVVHDDLDIRLGNFKIQKGVGPKNHNGIESIEIALKTKDFWRIRIGIDNRLSDSSIPGEPYVLSDFTDQESETLHKGFPKILQRLKVILKDPSNL